MLNKYKITYPVVALVSGILGFVILSIAGCCINFVDTLCFTALISAFAVLVARVILHATDTDVADEDKLKTWVVTGYFFGIVLFWALACFERKDWRIAAVWIFFTICFLVLAFGNRFIKDEDENGIPDKIDKVKSNWS